MPSRKGIVRPTAEQVFGQDTGRGQTVRYAREDHTHGTPLDPVIDVLSKILGSVNKVRIDDNGNGTITITLPGSIQLDAATSSRLLATDANKRTVSASLASWIAGIANKITVTDDGDGSVTLTLPNSIQLDGSTALRLLATDANKRTVSADLFAWIAGASGQVNVVDDGDGSVTIGTVVAFGHMNITTPTTVTITSSLTWYEVAGGFSAGELSGVTFGSSHFLKITIAGRYEIKVSVSFETGIAQQEIACTVMVNGTATESAHSHSTVVVASKSINVSGSTILNLAVNDEISIAVQNHTLATDIYLEHGHMSLVRVGN